MASSKCGEIGVVVSAVCDMIILYLIRSYDVIVHTVSLSGYNATSANDVELNA